MLGILGPIRAIGREGRVPARSVFFDQRSRFTCLALLAIAIAANFSVPAFGDFTLTDIGCSQAHLAASISAPSEALAEKLVTVNYSVSGISLQPTGEVCGECVRQEEYCAQYERSSCNCRDKTETCNCRKEYSDCNCRIEKEPCNCRRECSDFGRYQCGSYYDSCCYTTSYTYSCCAVRLLGRCLWYTTCTGSRCVGCYKPQYCCGCISYRTVCDTCTKRVCDTCEKTVCDTCKYRVCDTCETCVRTAWREVSTPCKWKWKWDFTATISLRNATGAIESERIAESDNACLAIKSGECSVKANFSLSDEIAFKSGNYTIAMLLSDAISGMMSYAWSTILVKGVSITTPFAQQAGETSKSGSQGAEAAALIIGGIGAAGATGAYIFRRRIVSAISPKLAETIAGGRFITGVTHYVNTVRVVATNSVKQLVGVIRNTYVSERVVARETSRQLIGIERSTVQIEQPAQRAGAFGSALFGGAGFGTAAAGAQAAGGANANGKAPNPVWNVLRGFGMEARNTVTGMLAFFGSAIAGALNYSAEAVESFVRDPAGSARAGLESIKAAGAIAAPRMLNALQNPLKTIAVSSTILGNALWKAGSMYWDALLKDPVSTVAKTLIVAGGVVAAIPTGGASLMIAGGVISAIGAGALLAKDAYEYATAENDAKLEKRVKENHGDSLWIVGGAVSGVQALKIAKTAQPDKIIYATRAELNAMADGEMGSAPAAMAVDESGKFIMLVAKDNPSLRQFEKAYTAHERFGELAIEKGVANIPRWIEQSEHAAVYRDIAADSLASRFVGRDILKRAGHDWWRDKPFNFPYVDETGLPRVARITPQLVARIESEISAPSWYSGVWGPWISGGLAATTPITPLSNNATASKWLEIKWCTPGKMKKMIKFPVRAEYFTKGMKPKWITLHNWAEFARLAERAGDGISITMCDKSATLIGDRFAVYRRDTTRSILRLLVAGKTVNEIRKIEPEFEKKLPLFEERNIIRRIGKDKWKVDVKAAKNALRKSTFWLPGKRALIF